MNDQFPIGRSDHLVELYFKHQLKAEELQFFCEEVQSGHNRLIQTLESALQLASNIPPLEHICANIVNNNAQIFFYMHRFPDVIQKFDELQYALSLYTTNPQEKKRNQLLGIEDVQKVIPPFLEVLKQMPLPKQRH